MFQDNRRKMHYLFTSAFDESTSTTPYDGIEMVEKYDANTSELLLQKYLRKEVNSWRASYATDIRIWWTGHLCKNLLTYFSLIK